MSLSNLLLESKWIALAITLLAYLLVKIRTYNRLKAFKGPFSTGFFEIWHIKTIMTMKSHLIYKDVCDKYGPIARIGPNDLITSSPEILAHMSAVRSPYSRTPWFYGAAQFQPGKDHVFCQLDEDKHMQRRQQMTAGYSGKENLDLESTIDGCIRDFLHLIRSKYLSSDSQSNPVDLARKFQFLTLDIISGIGFGLPFGDTKADKDLNNYIQSSEEGLLFSTGTAAFGINRLLKIPLIARLFGPSEKDAGGFGKLIATARSLVTARLASPTDTRSDMLASFIRHGISGDDLLSETLIQILAGSETTAAALRGIMLYLMSHPRVYRKLQEEIDGVVKQGYAPSIISDAESRKLVYLEAVIKESIRIHPPVSNLLSKRVPDTGDTVKVNGVDVFLPGGTNIGRAAWALHHSKEIFGDDADQFRPERWLMNTKDSKVKLVEMNRTHDLIFGYGRYQCLGKHIAHMELRKTVFELLRNFDWCLAKPETPWNELNFLGVFSHKNMWVQVTDRQT